MERKRERAIELIERGRTQAEVAGILDVNPRSIRRWTRAVRVGGKVALKALPASGRPPKLTSEQRQQLQQQLLQGALAAGFASDSWTCSRVAEHIERQFGVHYHVDHVGRLLHAMNWTSDRPARPAATPDQTGVGQWLQQVWSTLRKRR